MPPHSHPEGHLHGHRERPRTPGLASRIRDPPRTSMSIRSVSRVIASVKSSITSHHEDRSSSRRGTTQRPQRRTEPPRLSIRITSSACTVGEPDRPGPPVRSAVRTASSSSVREDKAASSRSSNSSAVSRPSPAAAHSTSKTRSRSASEALTPGDAPPPPPAHGSALRAGTPRRTNAISRDGIGQAPL